MSDAPETIYTSAMGKWLVDDATPRWPSDVKYRRADLPPTLEAAMQLPEVRALREALERIAHASDFYGVEANAEDQGADTLAYAHKSTCNLARAALAPFTEAKP